MKDELDTHRIRSAYCTAPSPAETVEVTFTDGARERHPLHVDPTMPKGWMLVEYTDGTAMVLFGGVLRAKLERRFFSRRWHARGTKMVADTPQELVRQIAGKMKL